MPFLFHYRQFYSPKGTDTKDLAGCNIWGKLCPQFIKNEKRLESFYELGT